MEHPVQTGDDDTSGEAVGRRERHLVHPDRDHRVRVHRSIQRDRRGVAVGAGEHDPVGRRIEARRLKEGGEPHTVPSTVADQVPTHLVAHALQGDQRVHVVRVRRIGLRQEPRIIICGGRRHQPSDRKLPRGCVDRRVYYVLRDDVELRSRRDFFCKHLGNGGEYESTLFHRKACESVDRQDRKGDRADAAREELSSAEAKSVRISRGDLDEGVVEHRSVHPGSEDLAEGRESRSGRGFRSEEPRVEKREDPEQDDPGRREREEGDHVPSSFQPLLDPPEKRRVDSRQDQKDDDGGEEREQLGSLPQGPDEERFDCPGDSPHGEVDRDLGEEQSEAERAQN